MRIEIIKNNRGMALLLTITIVTLLIAAALEMNRKVRTTVVSTANTRDRLTLSYMASAGIHASMAMLIKDKKSDPPTKKSLKGNISGGRDSVQEDWADPEKVAEVLQATLFEEGNVKFIIRDELAKIQVNALVDFPKGRSPNEAQKTVWDNLLRPVISQDEDRELNATSNIINSVIDWLDSGDDEATAGANSVESEYYKTLDPPYSCRNGPMPYLNELALVKGITPELFHGTSEIPGISEYMTVYGMTKSSKTVDKKNFTYSGKININTAELPVLVAIVGSENAECAQAIYDYRSEQDEGAESKSYVNTLSEGWYKNVVGCGDVKFSDKLITTTSDFFRIESTATLHEVQLTITSLIHREQDKKGKWKCTVLSWETG